MGCASIFFWAANKLAAVWMWRCLGVVHHRRRNMKKTKPLIIRTVYMPRRAPQKKVIRVHSHLSFYFLFFFISQLCYTMLPPSHMLHFYSKWTLNLRTELMLQS